MDYQLQRRLLITCGTILLSIYLRRSTTMNRPQRDRIANDRRLFLKGLAATGLGFAGLQTSIARSAFADAAAPARLGKYGPLVPDPAGVFDLPEGFSYQVVSRVGQRMDDGFVVPGLPDGMAAFPSDDPGRCLIVRNHELTYGDPRHAFAQGVPDHLKSRVWDAGSGTPLPGGTTTLLYDTNEHRLIEQHLSLAGTERNCAGGPTPRNSWITCEETVSRAEPGKRELDHGYCFEVHAAPLGSNTHGVVTPEPIYGMGRFNHEACCTSPNSGFVYMTEDAHDGLIYRFKPVDVDRLTAGGTLQALVVEGQPSLDTRNWDPGAGLLEQGEQMALSWIDMDNIHAPDDDLRLRGFQAGAARFARGEGMWMGMSTDINGQERPTIYIACTNGGPIKAGQIWKILLPDADTEASDAAGTLELFIEPNNRSVLENADNIAQAPWGDLFVCEDGSNDQFLLAVTPAGEV
ncbi:MAG: alkaline phosphatase PhoX, partial [Chloroflexota bacterium]